MDINKRLITRISTIKPEGGLQSVDAGGLLQQLLLFDTCLIKTHRLVEFPALVRSFGFDGTMELLGSGAVEVICNPATIATDVHRNGKRSLPLYHFDCGSVKAASLDRYVHDCLQSFHETLDIGHAKIKALKKAVVRAIAEVPENFGDEVLQEVKAEFSGNPQTFISAIRVQLNQKATPQPTPEFSLQFEFVPNVGFRAETNLATVLAMEDSEAHGIIQSAFGAVAMLDHRLGEMKAFRAVSGFLEHESGIFSDKCGFLVSEINGSTAQEQFQRVIRIADLPELAIDAHQGKFEITRLLEIRETDECKEFRSWLQTVHEADDKEIAARVSSLKARLSAFLRSGSGKVTRILTQLGIGLIPHYGIPAGLAAASIDSFLIDKFLPNPGVACFLNNLYPSLFKKD
jgi:hypothetical protein